ncbi:MAG: hypothetical protein J1E97_06475 [Muribaculaceae bacterium]|nr:hypothetical protein [Muribaculaceae bacterium]
MKHSGPLAYGGRFALPKGLLPICMVVWVLLLLGACSKNDGIRNNIPANFNSLSTEDKMDFLMERMPPDSVARFICDAAMGKVYNARIELQPARDYAYSHYKVDDIERFEMECINYENSLPLHEKVKFFQLAATDDPDRYAYELGLSYVGTIREAEMSVKDVQEELDNLRKECKYNKEFYKRFMTGFKTALSVDRHHDLNDNIYKKFINYPDNIK